VTLRGRGFGTAPWENRVQFGTVAAEVVQAGDGSTLRVRVPLRADSAPVSLSVSGRQAASPQAFRYLGAGHPGGPRVFATLDLGRKPVGVACAGTDPWVVDVRYGFLVGPSGQLVEHEAPDATVAATAEGSLWVLDERTSAASRLARVDTSRTTPAIVERIDVDGSQGSLVSDGADTLLLYGAGGVLLVDASARSQRRVTAPDGVQLTGVNQVAGAGPGRFLVLDGTGERRVLRIILAGEASAEPQVGNALLPEGDAAPFWALAANAAAGTGAYGRVDGSIGLLDVRGETPELLQGADGPVRLRAGRAAPDTLAFSPSGRLLYAASGSHVAVLEVATGTLLGVVDLRAPPAGSAACADGLLHFTLPDRSAVATFAAENGVLVEEAELRTPVERMMAGPGAREVHAAAGGRLVRLDADVVTAEPGVRLPDGLVALVRDPFAPAGVAWVTGHDVVGVEDGAPRPRVHTELELGAVAADGARGHLFALATDADWHPFLLAFGPDPAGPAASFALGNAWARSLALLDDGRVAVSFDESGGAVLAVFELREGALVEASRFGTDRGFDALAGGGPVLQGLRTARDSSGPEACPLDVQAGVAGPEQKLPLPGWTFSSVTLSPDGRRLSVGSVMPLDGIATFEVDATGVQPLRWSSFLPAPSMVWSVALVPAGDRAFASLQSGQVLVLE